MYIATIPNRGSPPAILLREGYREGGKVKTRTLGNLSHLPSDAIELLRRRLKGETLVSLDDPFEKVESWLHGHVDAVLRTMKRLGFEQLLASRGSRERKLVVAMVVARILEPDSKLATTRWWKTTTLPQLLGIADAVEDEFYAAMDWLLERQDRIEQKLAARHLNEDGLVLYDLSSSYFEGVTCPLAALGYNRDGKQGKMQVNYGLLTDGRGCPVAVSVFPGNTVDVKTLMPQVEKLKSNFGIQSFVLVGDRGMISQKLIDDDLRELEGVYWITALKANTIRKLVEQEHLQLGLFDEKNLFEFTHPDFPGERLVACRNPELAKRRAHKRQSLLDATVQKLEEVRSTVQGAKLRGKDKITRRVGKVINKQLAKHFVLDIRDDGFDFHIADDKAAAEAVLDTISQKLKKVRSTVQGAKLRGKDKIARRVGKVINKQLAKHFVLDIRDDGFDFHIADEKAAAEAALHGICQQLEEIRCLVQRGKFGGKDKIGVRIGKVVDKRKVAKHFVLDIRDDGFDFHINQKKVAAEAALDGIYIVHTSVPPERLSADDTVRGYKSLCQVERALRSIKTVDLKVRPIFHHLEPRVRAHIFLCMLAYYVEWHMREAWRPLLFGDEDQEAKKTRDPVAPAKRSEEALHKVHSRRLEDGTEVHSFQTLLELLSAIVRNACRLPGADPDAPTFEIVTTPDAKQQQAYDLLETIEV